ncbi:hypothetical protein SMU93_06273 [Streptococcus mutans 21]|nr:hypothetical protein SMU93_06273 [Streptococcus mutans 21]EMC46376.1 hypothetical protein SMU99_03279 [Streptococcus mutans 24]
MSTAIETTVNWVVGGNGLVVNGCDLLRFFPLYQEGTELEGVVYGLEIV